MEVLAPLTVDQTHCWYSPKWFLVKYTIQFLYVTKKLYVSGQDMCLTSQLYHFQEKQYLPNISKVPKTYGLAFSQS